MKLPHFSIQSTLLIALVLLSGLVVISSVVSWLAFGRINTNQQALLNQSLPAMRFLDNTVDIGVELLDLGSSLSGELSPNELPLIEKSANELFCKSRKWYASV